VSVYLVRHAKAGSRRKWHGPDEERPLDKLGIRQAKGIAEWLADARITCIQSSPYVRCRQTVEPLARRIDIAIEDADALIEGRRLDQALRLLEKVSDENAVLCTHGDIVEAILDHARRHAAGVEGDGLEKGATWVLDTESGAIVAARYVPPFA
jgi:8-oxo-dGTP diphosphatase